MACGVEGAYLVVTVVAGAGFGVGRAVFVGIEESARSACGRFRADIVVC